MTTTAVLSPVQTKAMRMQLHPRYEPALLCAGLTPLAVLVHGYHPYAEDGGIYLAGIKYLLHPGMFPYATGFVTAHLRFSVFAYLAASLVRVTALDAMSVMLMLHLAAVFLTLYSASMLVAAMVRDAAARRTAVLLLAGALSMPVAGTSLMLADPYVTARSFALPCVLFGLAAMLRAFDARRVGKPAAPFLGAGAFAIAVAVALHPLSGGYGAVAILFFGARAIAARRLRTWVTWLLSAGALALAFAVSALADAQPAGYGEIARTRTYWFLSQWAWYEVVGLIAPPLILLWFRTRRELSVPARALIDGTVLASAVGSVVALLFAHFDGACYAVARLQPLRIFQVVYVVMLLCLGVLLRSVLRHAVARIAVCVAVAGLLFATERGLYAHSSHLELPWRSSNNGWQQAFLWIRANTPEGAQVALDADYIEAAGEDAQNFRAISERSMPPDRSKDGGIAAIRPELAREWMVGAKLQRGLNKLSDGERTARLLAAKIDWVVLPATVRSALLCPYRNQAAAVCRVDAAAGFAQGIAPMRGKVAEMPQRNGGRP